jgi:hypothetical protein
MTMPGKVLNFLKILTFFSFQISHETSIKDKMAPLRLNVLESAPRVVVKVVHPNPFLSIFHMDGVSTM